MEKKMNGYVIWTRTKTPMEDGQCLVFRAREDALDCLKGLYPDWQENQWRISPVAMTAVVPAKTAKKK